MIDLIKEWFELLVKQKRLNRINRAADKYNRLNNKARMQAYVVHRLVDRYNEIYDNEFDVRAKNGWKGI